MSTNTASVAPRLAHAPHMSEKNLSHTHHACLPASHKRNHTTTTAGSGFAGVKMRGSAHNDPYVKKGDKLGTSTNRSGGIQGGISNGEPVYFKVAFKPPATIGKDQTTATCVPLF